MELLILLPVVAVIVTAILNYNKRDYNSDDKSSHGWAIPVNKKD